METGGKDQRNTRQKKEKERKKNLVPERIEKKEEAYRLWRLDAFSAVLVKTLHLRLLSRLVSDLTAEPGAEHQTLPPMKTSEKATDTITELR